MPTSSAARGGELRVLEQTKLTMHKAGRVAISVLLTGALLMPAFLCLLV